MCEGKFTKQFFLERHKAAVHEGYRPFKCHFCESSFSLKQNLERHQASVHKDRNHSEVPLEVLIDTQENQEELPLNSDEAFQM